MSGVVKGIGGAIGGAVKGARKGISKLGGVASKLAPLAGLIPGVGAPVGALLGLGGGLVSGQGLGKSLKRGLTGGLGAFGLSKLGGAKGIVGGLGKLLGKGGGGDTGRSGGQIPPGQLQLMQQQMSPEMFQQSLQGQKAGGGFFGGGGNQQQGQNFLSKIGGFLTGGRGEGGGGFNPLQALLTGGAGALALKGAGDERKKTADFQNRLIEMQRNRMQMADQEFASRAPQREAAFGRLTSAVNRQPSGIFSTSAQRNKPAGFIGGQ